MFIQKSVTLHDETSTKVKRWYSSLVSEYDMRQSKKILTHTHTHTQRSRACTHLWKVLVFMHYMIGFEGKFTIFHYIPRAFRFRNKIMFQSACYSTIFIHIFIQFFVISWKRNLASEREKSHDLFTAFCDLIRNQASVGLFFLLNQW